MKKTEQLEIFGQIIAILGGLATLTNNDARDFYLKTVKIPIWLIIAILACIWIFSSWLRRSKILSILLNRNIKAIIAASDIELFKTVYNPFHKNNQMDFFKMHDFGASFRQGDIEPLAEMINEFTKIQNSFIDFDIENFRKNLIAKAQNLKSLLARYSFDRNNDGIIMTVYPDLRYENPKKMAATKEINEAATIFYEAYINFFITARNFFGKEHIL